MFPERALEGHPVSHLPLLLVSFVLLTSSLGCATQRATAAWAPEDRRLPAIAEAGPPVFPTIEAAVDAALASADHERGPAARERFLFGTIRRVPGGYTWTRPVRSATTVRAQRPQGVRLPLGPEDVAIYGLHPRSGRRELDRVNEQVSATEQKAVDGQGDALRPLFVLTPSRRVVRYPEVVVAGPEAPSAAAADALEVVRREPAVAP